MTLKYFLPDWDDRLDPDFDFENDNYSSDHIKDPYNHDCYAHQIFKKIPYDGILVSLSRFQSKIELKNENFIYKIRNKSNIKEYLKIPKDSDLAVMGDCGAFSYVDKDIPPLPFYRVENIASIYEKLGFDYGVSVDHLAVDYVLMKNEITKKREKKLLDRFEKNRRVDITIKNAREFMSLHKRNKYGFTPVGVAQGFDIVSYKNSVNALIDMGYEYLAIGGLVQYQSEFILGLLQELNPIIKGLKLHLFGVLRPAYLSNFEKLGVTSFDSASFLRKAWLKSAQNYLSPNGKWYSAIRVPQSNNPRLIKNADLNGYSFEDLKRMEIDALNTLIQYDNGKVTLDQALKTVLEYDNLLLRGTSDLKDLSDRYFQTLLDKPWKSCKCDICKELGIQIIIFRGCNRNKRRGFHNIWTFRQIHNSKK